MTAGKLRISLTPDLSLSHLVWPEFCRTPFGTEFDDTP